MIQLIEYSIVSIAPTREQVLPDACQRCALLGEELAPCDVEIWLLSRYLSSHRVDVPNRYLRVAYRVLGRWSKPPLRYEEKQLRRLSGIDGAIRRGLGAAPVRPLRPPAAAPPPAAEEEAEPVDEPQPETEAPATAEGDETPPAVADETDEPAAPDDLTAIDGVGPKTAQLLAAAGITTFERLAATEVRALREILDEAGSRFRLAKPEDWPQQAREAARRASGG